MKTLKEFIIKEGFLRKNLGLGEEELIKKWMSTYFPHVKYTINGGYICSDYILMYKETLGEIPDYIRFGYIKDASYHNMDEDTLKRVLPKQCSYLSINEIDFIQDLSMFSQIEYVDDGGSSSHAQLDIEACKNLSSLNGCPQFKVRIMLLRDLPKLKSLSGAPKLNHIIIQRTGLTSLDGLNINNDLIYELDLYGNPKLTSLQGCPRKIMNRVVIENARKLKSLEHLGTINGGIPRSDLHKEDLYLYFVGMSDLSGLETTGNHPINIRISNCSNLESLGGSTIDVDAINVNNCNKLENISGDFIGCRRMKLDSCPNIKATGLDRLGLMNFSAYKCGRINKNEVASLTGLSGNKLYVK